MWSFTTCTLAHTHTHTHTQPLETQTLTHHLTLVNPTSSVVEFQLCTLSKHFKVTNISLKKDPQLLFQEAETYIKLKPQKSVGVSTIEKYGQYLFILLYSLGMVNSNLHAFCFSLCLAVCSVITIYTSLCISMDVYCNANTSCVCLLLCSLTLASLSLWTMSEMPMMVTAALSLTHCRSISPLELFK